MSASNMHNALSITIKIWAWKA